MSQDFQVAKFRQSLLAVFSCSAVGATSLWLLNVPTQLASAQALGSIDPTQSLNRAAGVVSQAQEMPSSQDPAAASQQTPSEIPEIQIDDDPTGKIATYQPGGATVTADNAFFRTLGTNGRTCFTCHQPQNGWTISAAGAQARFAASSGTDPLFRQIDGATCSTDPIATLEQRQQAFQLLTGKGLIRIFIQLPLNQFTSNMEFRVSKVDDPYNCTTNPATGLARNKKSGSMSMYRRPLPATNLGFLKDIAIMWDGREPNLAQQSIDATVGHAEAKKAPSSEQQDQIVAFETGIFTAQVFGNGARGLNAHGAKGGPVALSQELANFYIGINDPLGSNPKGTPSTQKYSISTSHRAGRAPKRTERSSATQSRAARSYSTLHKSISRGLQVSMMCWVWGPFPGSAAFATTRQMSATIRSRLRSILASPMRGPTRLPPSIFRVCRSSPSNARQVRSRARLLWSPIRGAH